MTSGRLQGTSSKTEPRIKVVAFLSRGPGCNYVTCPPPNLLNIAPLPGPLRSNPFCVNGVPFSGVGCKLAPSSTSFFSQLLNWNIGCLPRLTTSLSPPSDESSTRLACVALSGKVCGALSSFAGLYSAAHHPSLGYIFGKPTTVRAQTTVSLCKHDDCQVCNNEEMKKMLENQI